MAKPKFSTVGEEVLHVADGMHARLKDGGFSLKIEKSDIEYPRTPTIVARQGHTTLFVEVSHKFDHDVAKEWCRYGRSCGSDVQLAIAIPNEPGLSQSDLEFAIKNKIGVITFDDLGNGVQVSPNLDLAMHVELPELKSLPPAARTILGPIYRKFENADWRDGLSDGCLAVEELARKYLKRRSSTVGVQILGPKSKPLPSKSADIDKLTLGQMTKYFLGITTPNAIDSLLAKTIPLINPERIGAVHKKGSARVEKRLRAMAGKRMYAVVNCVKELVAKV